MMRLLASASILVLMTVAAQAFCMSRPDDASTGYVANNTALALCHQGELAQRTGEAAQKARIDAELGNLQMQIERQRLMTLQQPTLPAWPQL